MKEHKVLSNRNIIITGGPTREYIDPVRFISNPSSGKMGAALAKAAMNHFDDVIFIHGPIDSEIKNQLKCRKIEIESNEELLKNILQNLKNNSILIMAAAPVDFKPVEKNERKIKKNDAGLELKFKPNIDILELIGDYLQKNNFDSVFLAGFAAETDNFYENALNKLHKKKLDIICLNKLNDNKIGFNSDDNEVTIIDKAGKQYQIPLDNKLKVAEMIIEKIINMMEV